jgi:ribosome maturation factor RimP
MPGTPLAEEIARQVEAMGLEMVELEQAGNAVRPILRLYIDRPDSVPGVGETGVSLADCATVSRALEPMLDAREDLSDRYVIEVSSPGVERPLVRPRDYTRFAGQDVAVRGKQPLAGRAKRLEGTLAGLRGDDAEPLVALKLNDGEEVEIPLSEIDRANLVYRWERKERPERRNNPEE